MEEGRRGGNNEGGWAGEMSRFMPYAEGRLRLCFHTGQRLGRAGDKTDIKEGWRGSQGKVGGNEDGKVAPCCSPAASATPVEA